MVARTGTVAGEFAVSKVNTQGEDWERERREN